MEAIRQATGMPVDVFDVSHIERGSLIDQEIQATGVQNYEKRSTLLSAARAFPWGEGGCEADE